MFSHLKIIENYLKATSGDYYKPKILNVWEVNRETEVGTTASFIKSNTGNGHPLTESTCSALQGQRFNENDNLDNRRLLWHGTNIAVVAAILKSGLRIMPHSGGRVGCGIYFASENSKSAGYGKARSKKQDNFGSLLES